MSVRARALRIGIVATALAVTFGALGRGNWLHQVLSVAALLWIGLPSALAFVFLAVKRRHAATLTTGIVLWFLGCQYAVGLAYLHWDIHNSQMRCESLVPILDAIHAEVGVYPLSLTDDPGLAESAQSRFGPNLITYYSDGATFTLEVANPAELFGGFTFDHVNRQWREWRD